MPAPFYAKLSKYATKPMYTLLVLLFALAVGMQLAATQLREGKQQVVATNAGKAAAGGGSKPPSSGPPASAKAKKSAYATD